MLLAAGTVLRPEEGLQIEACRQKHVGREVEVSRDRCGVEHEPQPFPPQVRTGVHDTIQAMPNARRHS